jgi:flagellin-specific chaperone FliS
MLHPLSPDLSKLKDNELENKLQELSQRYFQTNNASIQHQLIMLIDGYKEELGNRRAKMWQDQYQKRDTDLDSLIKVS